MEGLLLVKIQRGRVCSSHFAWIVKWLKYKYPLDVLLFYLGLHYILPYLLDTCAKEQKLG